MNTYLVIYTEDGGVFWRPYGGTHADSLDALAELHEGARKHQSCTFEMHPIDEHLLQALSWEGARP